MLHGYFTEDAYRVSDTYQIRIRVGYILDTYPRRVSKIRYVLARILVSDTVGRHGIRPNTSSRPSIPSPQSAVTGALPWASTSGHPSLTRLSGWLDPAAGGRRAPSLAEFDRHEALNLLLHSNTLIWLLDFLCIIHPIAVTGGRLVQHLQRHH